MRELFAMAITDYDDGNLEIEDIFDSNVRLSNFYRARRVLPGLDEGQPSVIRKYGKDNRLYEYIRLLQEVQHPNIIRAYGVTEDVDAAILTLEPIHCTLRSYNVNHMSLLAVKGNLYQPAFSWRMKKMLRDLANILAHLHLMNYCYGPMSLDNMNVRIDKSYPEDSMQYATLKVVMPNHEVKYLGRDPGRGEEPPWLEMDWHHMAKIISDIRLLLELDECCSPHEGQLGNQEILDLEHRLKGQIITEQDFLQHPAVWYEPQRTDFLLAAYESLKGKNLWSPTFQLGWSNYYCNVVQELYNVTNDVDIGTDTFMHFFKFTRNIIDHFYRERMKVVRMAMGGRKTFALRSFCYYHPNLMLDLLSELEKAKTLNEILEELESVPGNSRRCEATNDMHTF